MNLAEAKKLWKVAKDNKLGGYKITGYLGSEPVPVMPAQIDGIDVVAIGNEAFRNSTAITGMILPPTLISLGKGAFRRCTELVEIELPALILEVPKQLFAGCTSLRRVRLPDAMVTIEKSAFESISEDEFAPMGLENLEISGENGAYSTFDGALYSKDGTKLLLCPCAKTALTLPQTLTEVPKYAFSGMKTLKTVTLPRNLKKIGADAFYGCNALETLDVPESVKTITGSTFTSCWNLKLTIRGAKTRLDKDALVWCPNASIIAPAGSPAEQYAQDNNLTFIVLE